MAVALVVLFHAGVPFLRGGYVGVDVFFVLSGFVITGLLLRRSTSRRGMGMVDFYARRARRILPMATVVIVATMVASYAVLGQFVGRGVADDARWTAVFLANVHAINVGTDYFHAGGPVSPLLHYWSLSVEEQFYLVFPMLLAGALVLGSRRARPRRVAMLLTGIVVSSLLLSGIQTRWSPLVAYFSPFTRAWELGLGGLCVLLTPWAARWPRAVGLAAGWIGLAGILAASTLFDPLTPFPGLAALLPVGATALVILAGSSTLASGPEVLLGRRSMQWGGDVSYSLYLWHWPVLVIAAEATTHPLAPGIRVLLVLAAVAMAEGSRRLVEDPVRHARALMTSTRRSIAMGALLVVGTLGLATVIVALPTVRPTWWATVLPAPISEAPLSSVRRASCVPLELRIWWPPLPRSWSVAPLVTDRPLAGSTANFSLLSNCSTVPLPVRVELLRVESADTSWLEVPSVPPIAPVPPRKTPPPVPVSVTWLRSRPSSVTVLPLRA